MKEELCQLTDTLLILIAKNPIFQSVEAEKLKTLLEREGNIRSFSKDEVIFSPQHFEESVGLILQGNAVAEKGHGSVILNQFTPGSCFGVATLFSRSKCYVTTVRAKSDCQVLFLSGDSMSRLFREENKIALNYIAFLASRIHFLNRKIDQFTATSAEEKLALWLLEQAELQNPIELNISYAKLADMLDLGRSSLYRALSSLEENGILKKEGKRLTILDFSRLEAVR